MSGILLYSEIFPPIHGGSGRWFYELYRRLPEKQVRILTQSQDSDDDVVYAHPVDRQDMRSFEWGLLHPKGLLFFVKQVKALHAYCRKHDITQIHAGRVLHEGFTAALVARLLKINLVVFVHGEDIETAAVSREHDLMAKFVFGTAKLTVCNSQNTQNILQRLSYARAEQSAIIHPGANMNWFVPAPNNPQIRQQLGWEDRFVVLTVGRLQIRAVAELISDIPELMYCIVGDGEERTALGALAKALNVEQHVQFLSDLSEDAMLDCYQQCDLFVLPNRTIGNDIEGFGMVLVEAQACNKPVIAGDSGGTSETMSIGESGFIIDCETPQALVEKITSLHQRRDALENMGIAGQKFVSQHFCWERHALVANEYFSELR
jgi:phosphatidylinositol alpha-1,6-mannosyltransferase